MAFQKAERKNARARIALAAPAGAGKTFGAITMAKVFSPDSVGVMDSERGSASKYARKDGTREGPGNWDFVVEELTEKNPQEYLAKIKEAAEAGIQTLVIDSYTHSWLGALEMIDRMGGWVKGGKVVSPLVAKIVDAMLSYPGHVIATMRQKSEHAIEKDEKTGRAIVRKVGMATVSRDGTDFEFDVMLDLTTEGTVTVSKTRCSALAGQIYTWDDLPRIAATIKAWVGEGTPVTPSDALAERIKFAQSDAQLTALVPLLNAVRATDLDAFASLKPLYMARKLEFQAAAE